MDTTCSDLDKCTLIPKPTNDKEACYCRNVPHALLLRERGSSQFQNHLASELQIAAEERLTRKQHQETRCELPDITRSTYLVVFSPDGKKMASSHGNHNVYVTDVKTGKNLNTLSGHPRTPWCIAFHPSSNQILASGCLGGQVRVWDLDGGSEMWTVEGETSIASLAFHPTARLLVVASYNEILFWDWSQPEPFAKCCTQNEKEKIRYVAFDYAGLKLITGIENPQPLQSQWDRVGPIGYVPGPGTPRGPRPSGPRPGFGPVFSHSTYGPGPGPPPAPSSPGHSTLERPATSQLNTRHDEVRNVNRHFNYESSGPNPRASSTSIITSAASHIMPIQNGYPRHHGSPPEDVSERGRSWLWRPQNLPRDRFQSRREFPSPRDSIANVQTLTQFRAHMRAVANRGNTEYWRLRAANRHQLRHVSMLRDEYRRAREELNSIRPGYQPSVFFPSFPSNLRASVWDLPDDLPPPHVPPVDGTGSDSSPPLLRSQPVTTGEDDNLRQPQSESPQELFGSNHSRNGTETVVGPANDNPNRRPMLNSTERRTCLSQRRSQVLEQMDLRVRSDLRVLSDQINSMQQCAQCRPRMNSSRLSHIRQLWAELQSQIRSLQVSIWENAGLASNAWHRLSFEAVTEMLSNMSHVDRDRIDERSADSAGIARTVSASQGERISTPGSDSHPAEQGSAQSIPGDDTVPSQTSAFGANPLDWNSLSQRPSATSSLSTSPESGSPATSTLAFMPAPPTAGGECIPGCKHSSPGRPGGAEALHITWVDRNSRGSTAVGVVSRPDGSPVGDGCSSASATAGSSASGRLFRVRRQNVFASSYHTPGGASRVRRSLPIQLTRLPLDVPNNAEPTAPQRSSTAGRLPAQLTCRARSASTGTLPTVGIHEGQSDERGVPKADGQSPNGSGNTSSACASSSPGPNTGEIPENVSWLRCRVFLRRPRQMSARAPRLSGWRGRANQTTPDTPSRFFGGRRTVFELTVDASTLCHRDDAGNYRSGTEPTERAPANMLMRIFRSLRRSASSSCSNILGSAEAQGSNTDAAQLPQSQDEPASVSGRGVVESQPDRERGPDGDVLHIRVAHPETHVRSQPTGSSFNVVRNAVVPEEWARNLLCSYWQQQRRARHQARPLSSPQVTRDGRCGGSSHIATNLCSRLQLSRNRRTGAAVSTCTGGSSLAKNCDECSSTDDRSLNERGHALSHQDDLNSTNTDQSVCSPQEEAPSLLEGINLISSGRSRSGDVPDHQPTATMGSFVSRTNTSGTFESSTPAAESAAPPVSESNHSAPSSSVGTSRSGLSFELLADSLRAKVENGKLTRTCSSSVWSKTHKSSKGKELRKCGANRKRLSYRQVDGSKHSLFKAYRRKVTSGGCSKETCGNKQSENVSAPSSSATFTQPATPTVQPLPEPTFTRQLEAITGRLHHLMFLQRNALDPSLSDRNRLNIDSSPLRNTGDAANLTHDVSSPPDAINTTSRLLSRLTESLTRQIQLVQNARNRQGSCSNNHGRSFESPPDSLGASHPPRVTMTSEARRRAQELLGVMTESLNTYSRDNSLGSRVPDNSVLEPIQTVSSSFWLLHGLYMLLHLALELTDVLLSHFISSYESNDSDEESRASASPVTSESRSAFGPPQPAAASSSSAARVNGAYTPLRTPTSSPRSARMHQVRFAVPTVQVNDEPIPENSEWQSPSSSIPLGVSNTHVSSPPTSFSDRIATASEDFASPDLRYIPFRFRPRLLHPYFFRQSDYISNDGEYAAPSLLFHLDYSRGGGQFVREPTLYIEENRIHRIQLWDFSQGLLPDLTKADQNIVVAECRIQNDASVDISSDGHLLVAVLPTSRAMSHLCLVPPVGQSVGVYSLVWESLGQLLYTTNLDQAAVSVALSPTASYLLVGLVTRRLAPNDRHFSAQIFRLEGAKPGRPVGARGRLNLHRSIELHAVSLNCITWAPMPGQGIVYGTNTGNLVMLR